MSIINIRNKYARRLVLVLAFLPILIGNIAVVALTSAWQAMFDTFVASVWAWRGR
jgi:hypothetical protein